MAQVRRDVKNLNRTKISAPRDTVTSCMGCTKLSFHDYLLEDIRQRRINCSGYVMQNELPNTKQMCDSLETFVRANEGKYWPHPLHSRCFGRHLNSVVSSRYISASCCTV
jgi:hypothetical protein